VFAGVNGYTFADTHLRFGSKGGERERCIEWKERKRERERERERESEREKARERKREREEMGDCVCARTQACMKTYARTRDGAGDEQNAREKASEKVREKAGETRNMRLVQTRPMIKCAYGVATISRLLKIIGLFCKRAL